MSSTWRLLYGIVEVRVALPRDEIPKIHMVVFLEIQMPLPELFDLLEEIRPNLSTDLPISFRSSPITRLCLYEPQAQKGESSVFGQSLHLAPG